MKKSLLVCLLAMIAVSTSLKAQEVTISLLPGWTWISYPSTEPVDISTAFGSFTPLEGDVIESQFGIVNYIEGEWLGDFDQFCPGYGYLYYSNRPTSVLVTFNLHQGDYHDYVDLGLPSGLLWATCNVGADTPDGYGEYFAWGETQPKVIYNWSSYQYCDGSYNTLTKYCSNSNYGYNGFTDNLTNLLPEDDAATANWGSDWRMPTQEEWQELLDNTTCTWTTQSGVNGRLFTASNGNSLFLPTSGYFWGSELFYAGSNGLYWSSSIRTDNPTNPWYFGFDSGICHMDGSYVRSCGFTVRPVRSAQNTAPTGAINGKFTINEDGGQIYLINYRRYLGRSVRLVCDVEN